MVEVGAVLIEILEKIFSKLKIWSMEPVDMSMLSNSHLVIVWKKYSLPIHNVSEPKKTSEAIFY
jgi:hypothetical protein